MIARIMVALFGVACPNCDRAMRRVEEEMWDCRCGAVADPTRGSWRMGMGWVERPLPGLLGRVR